MNRRQSSFKWRRIANHGVFPQEDQPNQEPSVSHLGFMPWLDFLSDSMVPNPPSLENIVTQSSDPQIRAKRCTSRQKCFCEPGPRKCCPCDQEAATRSHSVSPYTHTLAETSLASNRQPLISLSRIYSTGRSALKLSSISSQPLIFSPGGGRKRTVKHAVDINSPFLHVCSTDPFAWYWIRQNYAVLFC